MKNRFNLIFALILVLLGGNCLSLWGEGWGSDFSIQNSYPDNTVIPGTKNIYEDFGSKRGRITKFRIPCTGKGKNGIYRT